MELTLQRGRQSFIRSGSSRREGGTIQDIHIHPFAFWPERVKVSPHPTQQVTELVGAINYAKLFFGLIYKSEIVEGMESFHFQMPGGVT